MIRTILSAKKNDLYFLRIILFFEIICLSANLVSAQQRSIDWEVISISPVGNVENHHSLPLKFKFRNHGPDTWEHGDSILYVLSTVYNNENHVNYAGVLYNYYGPADSGQTLEYADPYVITFNYTPLTEPLTLDYCVSFYTHFDLANGDSMVLSYTDPDQSNNESCQQVTVYPDGSTAVSDPGSESLFEFSFFPNPADDRVTLRLKDNTQELSVTLSDITGKQVFREYFDSQSLVSGSQILDIARFSNGIYLLHIESGSCSATKKLIIQH